MALESGTDGSPRITLQVLGPGDVLGWSWLFPPFEWHFSARALEPCRVVALNGAALLIRAEEVREFFRVARKRESERNTGCATQYRGETAGRSGRSGGALNRNREE